MQDWKDNKRFFFGAMLAPTLWCLVFFIIPLGLVWLYSFGENRGLIDVEISGTFANYGKALSPDVLKVFFRSVWVAGLATLICLVAGFPLALAMTFASEKLKAWLLLAIMLPFWTNLLIRTYALIAVLRSKGVVNGALENIHNLMVQLGLAHGTFEPVALLYNQSAVIFGLIYVHLPFMVLPLYAALDRLDRSLIEASMDLGANTLQTIRDIIAPLAMPGILAGLIITFIPALGAYLTPDLLGGPDDLMIASLIERQFKRANDWPFGAALSFILMYITLAFFALRAFGDKNNAAKMGAH